MTMRIGRLLAVIALLNFAGAHWVVLQSIAWSSMLAKQVQHSRLAEAVQKTFDGAHPCDLCKGISRAQEKERKPTVPVEIGKLPLLFANGEILIAVRPFSTSTDDVAKLFPLRPHRPVSPPPRVSLS
jgi:hypothetical protein